jgi:predicted amino acid dehydrogenase
VLTEVKSVRELRLTKQLEDYIAYAAENGYAMKLIIRSDTKIVPALQDALDAARIEGLSGEIVRSLP